jgi:hypothetical protein
VLAPEVAFLCSRALFGLLTEIIGRKISFEAQLESTQTVQNKCIIYCLFESKRALRGTNLQTCPYTF